MSKSNSNRRSRRLPQWAIVVLSVLVSCLVLTTVGALSTGFTDWKVTEWFEKEVNPDNLLKAENYVLKTSKVNEGLEFTVDDYGVIKVDGKASKDYEAVIATITLEPGTYTIGGYDSDANKMSLAIVVNAEVHYAGNEGELSGATFTVEETTAATVKLVIAEDANFILAATVRPTLAVGLEEIDFFA